MPDNGGCSTGPGGKADTRIFVVFAVMRFRLTAGQGVAANARLAFEVLQLRYLANNRISVEGNGGRGI